MQLRATKILWTAAGFAGGIFVLFLVAEWNFSEMLAGIATKKGNLTFFGWCMIIFIITIVWLMVWRMLKEIGCRTSFSALIAFIAAVCIGLLQIMDFGYEWPFETFGITGLLITMGLLIGCLLILIFIRIRKAVMDTFGVTRANKKDCKYDKKS